MGTTLTVRTNDALRSALQRQADDQGLSLSEWVREVLEEAVAERPLRQRVSHLRGRLEFEEPTDVWAQSIRQRNWRP